LDKTDDMTKFRERSASVKITFNRSRQVRGGEIT